ncbi:MAG: leucine-rich repeat domain-containing protein, partial [Lachnospiraceae bacterium]|nr:leucine-rich repeat domain-containing protein [Lachnospiraceae bacterium]
MKKRRVLALLLALSLAMSTNGMTVFAAEAGELTASVVSPVEESTEDVQDEAELTDTAGDDADDEQDIESEDTEENEESDGDSAEDQTGKGDDGTNDGEDSDEQNPDVEDAADETGETVSENELPDEEEPAEESEELPQVIKHEVRMMTFTDDTGLKVTYDANAARNYKYIVENGVLTKVQEAKTVGENGEPAWEDVTFTGNVELIQPEEGEKYTSVAAGIFSGNKNITYVKLPDGVTGIEDNTFKDCTGLKGVYLPATVTSIGASAFESCTSMTQIAVPKAVTAIGNSAFKNDAKLYMVYMKDVDYSALTSIGDSAFEGCTALAEFCSDTEFYLPASLKSIGEKAFYQCWSIEKVDLNTAELETVGTSAFENCTGVKGAVMCKTLAEIPANAFKDCTGLEFIRFSGRVYVTVGEYAFYGCYSLKQVELPATVRKVSRYAFAGCTNLSSVVVENPGIELEADPFPAGKTNGNLVFVGKKFTDKTDQNSTTAIYAYYLGLNPVKVSFVDPSEDNSEQYYTYKVADSNGGNLTGGQIWVCEEGKNRVEDDINKLHNNKGVPSDGKRLYVYYKPKDGYELVKGSLKSNGETVQQDDEKRYYITMPYGGTVITAEFREKDVTDKIIGVGESDVTIEFSNGEPIQPDGIELKIGQTTRMFLLDKNGKTITASQIKEISSDKTSVAKVSASGVITAVGAGTAYISVRLVGADSVGGESFLVRRMVRVVEGKIASISLSASNYSSNIQITGDKDGIQTAAVGKNYARDGLTLTLKANAYTAEREGIAKELTWKSSDTKVATLEKASTTSEDSSNVVKIVPGTEGEATITVTAKIDSKTTVTQKFVVSVRDYNLKLSSSTVTINPNLVEHGELEILSAYGASLPSDGNPPKLIEKVGNDWVGNSSFLLQAKPLTDGDIKSGRRSYSITLRDETLKDGKYKVYVCFDDTARDSSLPLTITVKRSVPAPTVKFNTTKAKFNLFYKNGGTDKDGNPITVITELTKLGTAKVKKVELCALTEDKADDKFFRDNFEIVNGPEEWARGIVKIQKKNDNLKYTTGNSPKAVVSGYLKIYYEGYRDDVAKMVKVTMPTVTTVPAYVLDRTSVTYRDTASSQTESLMLLDKKTKQQIVLNSNVNLRIESDETIADTHSSKIVNDEIIFDVPYPAKGKIKIFLTNPAEWDKDKNGDDRTLSYTFTVKTTSAEPTIKTNQTVTLNLNYPEVAGAFTLVSNQKDTELQETQEFTANSTARTEEEYRKFKVTYQGGRGSVEIISDEKVKAGTI